MADVKPPYQPHFTSQPKAFAHAGVSPNEPVLGPFTAEGWVYVGLTIFLLLAFTVGRAWQRIRDGLDARIAETRRSLDEAAALRREAEALLAEAHARQKAAEADAEAILAHARTEADALVAKAEADLDQLVVRRRRLAEEKIAAEERQALGQIRAQAADLAVGAAARLLERARDTGTDRQLVDRTIEALGRR